MVTSAVLRLLQTPSELLQAVGTSDATAAASRAIISAGSASANEFKWTEGPQLHGLLRQVVTRVTIDSDRVEVQLSRPNLRTVLGIEHDGSADDHPEVQLTVPAELRPRGIELKFVITDPGLRQKPRMDPTLITAIVRAHGWLEDLMSGRVQSLRGIATRDKLHDRYVRRILELAFLAPDITETILDGRQPADLMLQEIVPDGALPLGWTEQRKLLRIA